MSEEEQQAIAGKTLLEFGAVRKKLAALQSKATSYANAMRSVAGSLHPPQGESHQYFPRMASKDWNESLEKIPTKEDILQIAREIEDANTRKRELSKTMKDMGFEPKED